MSWTRKHKRYERPRKLYDKQRIDEENELLKKYGLKNKKEIWKAESAIGRIRERAKKLITAGKEEQEKLFNRLNKMGFKVSKIADVLELKKENWLKRRLQSILIAKGTKPKQARQLIAHKHVFIEGKTINIPSYIVKVNEEDKIQISGKIKNKIEKEVKKITEEEKALVEENSEVKI